MSSDWLELSLGTPQQTHIPCSVADLMNYISSIKNMPERLSTLNEYVEKLEQEIQKMNAWDPHYGILLLKDAVEFLRKEGEKIRQKMECEESNAPMLKINFDDKEERAVILGKVAVKEKNRMLTANKKRQKSAAEIPKPYKLSIRGGGAFTPYKPSGPSFSATSLTMKLKRDMEMEIAEGSSSPRVPPQIQTSTRVKTSHRHIVPDVKERGSQQENQEAWKNDRRCWSPQLHASFMAAAQLLGGPQVATPKQIRRIMQVEGLTNDQVKSHLQKVRLQNKDPQVHNIEAANQHIAKPANRQARFQDSWAAEDQSGHSRNTRIYPSFPPCPLNLAGATGEICAAGSVYEEDKDAKPGSYWFRSQFHVFGFTKRDGSLSPSFMFEK